MLECYARKKYIMDSVLSASRESFELSYAAFLATIWIEVNRKHNLIQ